MGISFKIEGLNNLVSDLEKVPTSIQTAVRKAIKQGLVDIGKHAGRHHRYKAQSGNLDKAYGPTELGPPGGPKLTERGNTLKGELFLSREKSSTPYARRIHEGFGTWQPDKFLDRAVRAKRLDFEKLVSTEVIKAIKKAGF